MTFLGVAAALVPIIGSLWAGCWFLVDQMEARRERRVRLRVAEMVAQKHRELRDQNLRWDLQNAASRRIDEFREMMLRANGIEPGTATYTGMEVDASMRTPVAPRNELTRQWLVIGSALLGVVFLALDGLI